MSQRPTDAEARARVEQSRAVYAAVTEVLGQNAVRIGHEKALFLVTLPQRYRKASHPVLGEVDVDAVLGLRADNRQQASDWTNHWLGRAWSDLLDYSDFLAAGESFPNGCPHIWEVPSARYYVHPQGSRIIVWADGSMDAYSKEGKRKQTSATPGALEQGHGAWRETFYSVDGEELTLEQLNEIAIDAGVY